jgi:hypothetical protein
LETGLRGNKPDENIAEEAGCVLVSVRRMSANLRRFGFVVVPKVRKRGRPLSLMPEMVKVSVS